MIKYFILTIYLTLSIEATARAIEPCASFDWDIRQLFHVDDTRLNSVITPQISHDEIAGHENSRCEYHNNRMAIHGLVDTLKTSNSPCRMNYLYNRMFSNHAVNDARSNNFGMLMRWKGHTPACSLKTIGEMKTDRFNGIRILTIRF